MYTTDVLGSTVNDGEVRLNLGEASTGAGIAAGAPYWGIEGFCSRPNDPDSEGACMAYVDPSGDIKRVTASRDNRYADKVGLLQPGDRAIFSKGAARLFLKNADDAVTLYTERQSDGMSMLASVSGKSGKITMAVGLTKLEISEDEIELSINGGPAVKLSKLLQTVAIRGNSVNIDGGWVTVGLYPGGARPLNIGVDNALHGPLGVLGVPSASVYIAP